MNARKLGIITAACLLAWPAAAYVRTEAENKAMFREIVGRFNYNCPEVKSMDAVVGSETDLLILCGSIGADDWDRDMAYVVYPSGGENRVRKTKMAPRNVWEWLEDWF